MMSVPDEMMNALEEEMQMRRLDSVQETVRQIISNYLKEHMRSNPQIRPL